jgi:glycosyltransferase involved in cell wall biosynthesis
LINGRLLDRDVPGMNRYIREISQYLPQILFLTPKLKHNTIIEGILWEQFCLPFLIRRTDLLWSPINTGPLAVSNQVVTIHDLIYLEHPEWFSQAHYLLYRSLQPWLARRVRRVLTVSEFSRQRIVSVLGIPPEKVITIPLGVGEEFSLRSADEISRTQTKQSPYSTYLLTLSTIEPRKNLARLLQAWQQLQPKFPDVSLLIAGNYRNLPRNRLGKLPTNVRLLGYVDDENLPSIYRSALCFVFPSLYEGFGLPPLEAMACGTPVAASNATSIPEVVGEAGLLFDPYNVDEMAWAMERLIQDSALREKLRQKGLERARQFTWEKTAQGVWDVLSQALET